MGIECPHYSLQTLPKNVKKKVNISVLIIFLGTGWEVVGNEQLKQIFLRKNVRYAKYAPCLSHILDDKLALSNISSERFGPFGLIFHIKHLGVGEELKFMFFMQICYSRWQPCQYMVARAPPSGALYAHGK